MGSLATTGILHSATQIGEVGIMANTEKNANNDVLGERALDNVFKNNTNINENKANNQGYLLYVFFAVGLFALIYFLKIR